MIATLKRSVCLCEKKIAPVIITLYRYAVYTRLEPNTVNLRLPFVRIQTYAQSHTCVKSLKTLSDNMMNMQGETSSSEVRLKSEIGGDEQRCIAPTVDMCTSPPKKVFVMTTEDVCDASVRTVSVNERGCGDVDVNNSVPSSEWCPHNTADISLKDTQSSDVNMSVPSRVGVGNENKLDDCYDLVSDDARESGSTDSFMTECQHTDEAVPNVGSVKLCNACCAKHITIAPLTVVNSTSVVGSCEDGVHLQVCNSSAEISHIDITGRIMNSEEDVSSDELREPCTKTDVTSQEILSSCSQLGITNDSVGTLATQQSATGDNADSMCETDFTNVTSIPIDDTNSNNNVFSHFDDDLFLRDSVLNDNSQCTELPSRPSTLDKEALFAELPFLEAVSLEDLSVETPKKKKKKKSKKERKEKQKKEEDGSGKTVRPNYFVAIQVSDPEIVLNIESVQKSIVTAKPALKPALISPKKLHITVKVIVISEEDDMIRAFRAMECCQENLAKVVSQPLKLQFETLGNFQHKVLFATIIDQLQLEQLKLISDTVQSCFEASGFPLDDDFKPHVTIAKLSKAPQLRRKKIKQISVETYKLHTEQSFGTEVVKSLQLLSMVKPADANGYYHCVKEVFFEEDAKAGGDATKQMPETKSQDGKELELNAVLQNAETQMKAEGDNVQEELNHTTEYSEHLALRMQDKADVTIAVEESLLGQSEVHNTSMQETTVLVSLENEMSERGGEADVTVKSHNETIEAPALSIQAAGQAGILEGCVHDGEVQDTALQKTVLKESENCNSPLLKTTTQNIEISVAETEQIEDATQTPVYHTDANKRV